MKRFICLLLAGLLCTSLAGCAKTYRGTQALVQKAREEIPIAEADTIELAYAGMSVRGEQALAWFISGNAYQAHYYLPMEVTCKGENQYTYVRTYKTADDVLDIAVLHWNDGYAFCVNNPACVCVRITDAAGVYEREIAPGAHPYVFYWPSQLTSYEFLDAGGDTLGTS